MTQYANRTSKKEKRSNNKEYCTSTGIIDLECCAENCNGGCTYEKESITKIPCPKCKKLLVIDPAGSKLWHCTTCRYAWKDEEIIDMDGVICNYQKQHKLMKSLKPKQKFPQSTEAFWTTLEAIDGAIVAINKLRESHDVYILSGPSTRNVASYSGKRIWIESLFDMDMAERLILCNFKGLVKGDILIDDNLTGKGQEKFEGSHIWFGSKEYPDWTSVLKTIYNIEVDV